MLKCRSDGSTLTKVLDLGSQPLGNGFLAQSDFGNEFWYSLTCGFSESSLLFQLVDQPDAGLMFHDNYKFQSSTSQAMSTHFERLFDDFVSGGRVRVDGGLIVELGCNDGVFLRHAASQGIRHVGVEPSRGVGEVARDLGVNVLDGFFTPEVAHSIQSDSGKATLIYAANVMCHISDIDSILGGVDALLADDGFLVFEDPYLGDVVQKVSYDQIYDEHVFLFSALSVQRLFNRIGLELVDVEHLDTHGGSMRYWLARPGHTQPLPSVAKTLKQEYELGLHSTETFVNFAANVAQSAEMLRATLEDLRSNGLRVSAFGATSKSTTVYNYAGIGPTLIESVFDNTESKIGLYTPGVHIPVVSDIEFKVPYPDTTFLGAWNHSVEIQRKYPEYELQGGRWLTHVPDVHFVP